MSANVEGMVREGINAFKAGKKDEARVLLSKAVELDPYNEDGWLWLSGVVTSVDDQRTCLENVLAINPGNSRARSGLDFLNRQNPPPAPPVQSDPEPPATAAPAAMAEATTTDNPTSVEWADYDEPVDDSGWHEAPPPPTEAYDEWVTGLQLTGPQTAAPAPEADLFAAPGGGSSPFFGSDEDLAELTTGASLFDDDDPFGATGAAVALTAATTAPAAPPASTTITFRPPPMDDDEDAPDSVAASASAPAAALAAPPPRTAAGLADLSVEADEIVIPENGELIFPDIPKEIKATRLPGTNERVPILLRLAVIVLALLTFGSAILFFWKVI